MRSYLIGLLIQSHLYLNAMRLSIFVKRLHRDPVDVIGGFYRGHAPVSLGSSHDEMVIIHFDILCIFNIARYLMFTMLMFHREINNPHPYNHSRRNCTYYRY